MELVSNASLPMLLRQMDMRLSAWLLLLMVASALTEGIGLILLVPMLSALSGGAAGDGRIESWIAAMGLPVSLGPLLVVFAVLVSLRAVINSVRAVTSQRFEMQVVDGLRSRVWDALLHCDWRVVSAMRQSDNTSLLITNIDRIGDGFNALLSFLALAITLVGLGAAAFAIAPLAALAAAAGGAIVLFVYRRMRRRATMLGMQLGAAYRDIHGNLSEGLRSLREIKSLGLEQEVSERGTASFANLRKAQISYVRDIGLGQIVLHTAGAALLATAVWFSMTWHYAGISQVLPLVALFARGLPLLGALQEAWQNWAHCSSAIGETISLIRRAENAREPEIGSTIAPVLADTIAFDHATVSFCGTSQPALDDASLVIQAGSITALIGPSGSGKSTLADLAGGLLAPDSGSVSVDGKLLEGVQRRAWRTKVAYVQQESVVFSGTIRENLARASPAADEVRIRRALTEASALFVDQLPDGINTLIGEGGRRLSGGEQQRIALARALMRDPALLILDEATSALDTANEAAITQAIAALKGKLTIMIIAHRGALVGLADQVVRLDSGRIVAIETSRETG